MGTHMSKINQETLNEAIKESLEQFEARNKERKETKKFVETFELQIGLKGFDPARDKRINAVTVLPVAPKLKNRYCLLGNEIQCEEAAKIGLDYKTQDDLKTFKRDKKLVKKMAKQYDMFIASSTLIRRIPRLLGPTLNEIGKFPSPITPNESVENKIGELSRTVRGSLKFKVGMPMCLAFAFANCSQDQDTIRKNLNHLLNYLITQFKKGWQNVKRIHIKTTMGMSKKIYGF